MNLMIDFLVSISKQNTSVTVDILDVFFSVIDKVHHCSERKLANFLF